MPHPKKKKPRFKRDKIDAFKTFSNASSYQRVATILDDVAENEPLLAWPLVVNEALALELFLKALHEARRRIMRGHPPSELFAKLSKSDRTRIEIRYNAIILGHPNAYATAKAGVPMEIDAVLKRSDNLFVGGRYWHEGLNLTYDDLGFGGNAGVGTISDAIRDLLYSINPDWKKRIQTTKFPHPGIARVAKGQVR